MQGGPCATVARRTQAAGSRAGSCAALSACTYVKVRATTLKKEFSFLMIIIRKIRYVRTPSTPSTQTWLPANANSGSQPTPIQAYSQHKLRLTATVHFRPTANRCLRWVPVQLWDQSVCSLDVRRATNSPPGKLVAAHLTRPHLTPPHPPHPTPSTGSRPTRTQCPATKSLLRYPPRGPPPHSRGPTETPQGPHRDPTGAPGSQPTRTYVRREGRVENAKINTPGAPGRSGSQPTQPAMSQR